VSESSWGFKSPLAHLLQDSYRRPRRRRRRLVIPIVLTVVVGFGLLLALTTGGNDSPLYSEELRKSTVELSLKADTYRNLVLAMGTTDRALLDETTTAILTTIGETEQLLSKAPDDPAYAAPVEVMRLALDQWRTGLEALRTEILAVADDTAEPLPSVRLLNSLIDMRGGDRLFRSFVASMEEADVTQPVSPFPVVEFVPVQIDMGSLGDALLLAASNPGSPLKLRAELALTQVITEPELIVNTDGGFVVTDTEALVVKAVVSNGGNTVTEPIELRLTLLQAGEVVAERAVKVDPVEPGAQTTVAFDVLDVVPGSDYSLIVSLPISAGEEITEDNQRAFDFRVNEPVSTSTTAA
jgi:hypothetical protein